MGELKNFVTEMHNSTKRDYLSRMIDSKVDCMLEAKKYDINYWDGDRRYGYGGYKYIDGYWKKVALKLIKTYNLTDKSKILDVGCGKAFLLYEIQKIIPKIKLVGIDISQHAIDSAFPEIRKNILNQKAQELYPFQNDEFDLVISFTTLHNLKNYELDLAISEITRVGKNGYILVESYRSEKELFNLQCWALTCETFFEPEEWKYLFKHNGYSGDFEFIYFE